MSDVFKQNESTLCPPGEHEFITLQKAASHRWKSYQGVLVPLGFAGISLGIRPQVCDMIGEWMGNCLCLIRPFSLGFARLFKGLYCRNTMVRWRLGHDLPPQSHISIKQITRLVLEWQVSQRKTSALVLGFEYAYGKRVWLCHWGMVRVIKI